MKLERIWLPVMIGVLIIASALVVFGPFKQYDKQTHSYVPVFPLRYGLDIKGGLRAVLQADRKDLPPGTVYNASLVQTVLENRINASGVSEATVQPKGQDQFIIELPDVHDKTAILNRLGTTAEMVFYYFQDVSCKKDSSRPVTMDISHAADGSELYKLTDKRTNRSFRDGAQIRGDMTKLMAQGSNLRPGAAIYVITGALADGLSNPTVYFTPDQQKTADGLVREMGDWQSFLSDSPVVLRGADIKPVSRAQMGGQMGVEPIVTQEFTDKGADEMSTFTSAHTNEIMGIVLDDKILSAPNIESEISDEGQIEGGFTDLNQAQDLANLLNAGALPVPLTIVQTESVEASLGSGAVHRSIQAGLLGLALVLVFMIFWYRLPGVLADVALLIYALFTMAIFRGGLAFLHVPGLDGVVMTLPGIAGFILSIGMAVDANILIFERMKEELRSGKSLKGSIDAGFRRAFPAIRDSNICTMITCIVLLTMGSASVRGFATTLLIGVIVSLFSAITVTRTLLYSLVNAGVATNPVYFNYRPDAEGAPQRNWNIIGRRKFFYGLSVAIILPGCIYWAMGGLKRGIDFTGGTQIQVAYNQPVLQATVLRALKADPRITDPLVQMAESGKVAIVSTQWTSAATTPSGENIVQNAVDTALATIGPMTPQSADRVAGVVSKELTNNAIQAVILAAFLIVCYLAYAFSIGGFIAGLRMGTSAIVALIHDVLVLIGVFSILCYYLNWKIDSLFVTATLTVIGFSVHNTVVIFDRIRENLRNRIRGESFEHLVNHSTLQTMDRSIRTSGTVLMTLLALLILGGQTTFALNLALFIGILSGTYSAIFNASAILVDWENWLAKRRAEFAAVTSAAAPARPAVAGASANGGGSGTPRPVKPTREVVTVGTPSSDSDSDASRIKPKKKKPARRF